nr:MAG TPA: hypothetical protein [Caudoviricetes sp.]
MIHFCKLYYFIIHQSLIVDYLTNKFIHRRICVVKCYLR